MRPPLYMFSIICSRALGLPDISIPTSKPPTIPSLFCTSFRSSLSTFTTHVAPSFFASSSRHGFTSVTTTFLAPTWRAIAAAMQPIGPAPVIRTSSPVISKDSAVWVAFPKGSKIAAISSEMASCTRQAFCAGTATYSAKQPSRFTPIPIVLGQR